MTCATDNDSPQKAHNTATTTSSVTCPHCNSSFVSLAYLNEHIIAAHPSTTTTTASSPPTSSSAPPPPSSQLLLPQHLAAQTTVNAVQKNIVTIRANNNEDTCPQCGTPCLKEDLEKHLTNHCPVVQECKICQKTFANVYRLQRHMLSHEESTELRKFKCPECAKAFKFKHHLKEHIRIHSGEKPFQCSNCGKRFSHSGSYSSHMTSKKCWVGNTSAAATMKARNKTLEVPPPRQGDVLRPLVPKEGEKNGDLLSSYLYHPQSAAAAAAALVDPNLLQYTLALQPFLPYTGHAAALSPFALNNFQQLLMSGKLSPAVMNQLMTPGMMKAEGVTTGNVNNINGSAVNGSEDEDKKISEEKENVKKEAGELIKTESEVNDEVVNDEKEDIDVTDTVEEEDEMMDKSEAEHHDDESIKKVLENIEATAASQQQEGSDKLSTLALAASELKHMSNQCRFCNSSFTSAIDLHQHERYMCPRGLSAVVSGVPLVNDAFGNNDDRNSDDGHGCRVRSILTDEQKRRLEIQYGRNPWPTKLDMEQLASDTGLARRVIQVWFQNCRARDRRKGKAIPERPVGLRTPDNYVSNSLSNGLVVSKSSECVTPSRPYIPRVPQVPRPVLSTYSPPHTTNSSVMTSNTVQIEPLDLSNKAAPSNHVLNLSTKIPTPPPQVVVPPSGNHGNDEELINTTPAHSTPRTTPDRILTSPDHRAHSNSIPSSLATAVSMATAASMAAAIIGGEAPQQLQHQPQQPSIADLASLATSTTMRLLDAHSNGSASNPSPPVSPQRTSTPHQSSPAVFPNMVPSPHHIVTDPCELTPTSLESSFSSTGSDPDRKRSWKQLESDDTAEDEMDLSVGNKRKRKSWKQHRVETMDGMYTCDQCDKLFSKQSSLARHKYEHSGQRPFPCDVCGKAFKHKHHLTEHKRLHSGEKPFECTKCSKRFSHSGSYSQHMNHRYKYCKPEGASSNSSINADNENNNVSQNDSTNDTTATIPDLAKETDVVMPVATETIESTS